MGYDRYECDSCGACCKGIPIVEITELDVAREPRLAAVTKPCPGYVGAAYVDEDGDEVQPLVPAYIHGAILACGSPCPLLGGDNLCTIYPTRPNCCVGFQPGTELCQASREGHGLPRLEPVERGVELPKAVTTRAAS